MKSYLFILGIFFVAKMNSHADSGCWPEEALVGKTAAGYIEGINFKFRKIKSSAVQGEVECNVEVFKTTSEKAGSIQPCSQIQCIKGECGDGGDYTSLPVESNVGSFVQVMMKDGKKTWLKLNSLEIKPVLFVGKVGRIFPDSIKVLDSPNGRPLKLKLSKMTAYTVLELSKTGNEEWAKVEVNPILSEEPPVKVGKSLATAYFKLKNSEGRIEAVLSDIWCD